MILDDVEGLETRAELTDILTTLFDRVAPREAAIARADEAAAGKPDPALWDKLNGEIGVVGLTVPEALGGGGATVAEAAVLHELLGRRVAATPYLGTFLAAEALVRPTSGDARERWLPALVGGESCGAVTWTAGLTATPTATGWAVDGSLGLVVDGMSADVLVGPAATDAGVRWFAIDLAGCARRRLEALDLTREFAEIRLDAAPALPLTGPGDDHLSHELNDLATLSLAAEQLGVAEQAVEDAVTYAKLREQFGRVIGSFQSVKHLLADLATEADLARSLVEHALWVAIHRPAELREAAAMAMLGASRAAVLATAENVQVHGGIGFSWEHPAHLYFRKARSNEALLASRAELSDRILTGHGL